MAYRKIYKVTDKFENEFLHKKSKDVTVFDDRLKTLIKDMKDTVKKANGAGLSAVQVGVLLRVFIVDQGDGDFKEFVNPTILSASGNNKILEEGCLSVPNAYAKVNRPNKVKIKAYDENGEEFFGEATGFTAKAICHEYDHLDGIIYTEKALPNTYTQIKE